MVDIRKRTNWFRRWLATQLMPEDSDDSQSSGTEADGQGIPTQTWTSDPDVEEAAGVPEQPRDEPPPPPDNDDRDVGNIGVADAPTNRDVECIGVADSPADNDDIDDKPWGDRIRDYCAPRFTELDMYKGDTPVMYLHCAGCGEDHAAGYFSAKQRALPPELRLCIGREGFVRICDHTTVQWEDVERLFRIDQATRHRGLEGIWCDHPACSVPKPCGYYARRRSVGIDDNKDVSLKFTWDFHYSSADLEREQGSEKERLRAAMARRHGGDDPSKVLCPVSRFGPIVEEDFPFMNWLGLSCKCYDYYGNPKTPYSFCSRYSFCLGVICSTLFRDENGGRCATVYGWATVDSRAGVPVGSIKGRINPGKGWFSMIHPDSYNEPGPMKWCNSAACRSYLLVGEPHLDVVPERDWKLRRPCILPCA
ncbi:hypothetical protein B0T24DRAFT_695498 [Lasiosphaeria ovina]|uniref:Uncharacterized protein n=1 Tax=Lasiosphaeria ovina TaxID=92902 RepID=A0AAE0NDR0_9PEZI|nr:hypothetical protein B0T24DRAFT_695498 [Lasiosphaeria ovina]